MDFFNGLLRWPGGCEEHVFRAVVPERFAGKAAVQRLHPKARDIDEREPFILGCPPEGALPAVVERNVDPVLAYRVTDHMRDGLVLMFAIQPRSDSVIEGESVPSESSVWPQRRGDPFEGAPAVVPRGQVQERPEWTVDQRRRLIERQVTHVALSQV